MRVPPTVDLAQRDTVGVIATGRLKQPAPLPLAASGDALEALAGLESVTNGRLRAEEAGLPDLDPRELVFGRADYTFVNAAFTHTRPGGNRFNDSSRGAWYCGFEAETAVTEVGFHLGRELAAIDRFDNVTDYAELIADFVGPFHDIRGTDFAADPCVHADPAIGYPAGAGAGTAPAPGAGEQWPRLSVCAPRRRHLPRRLPSRPGPEPSPGRHLAAPLAPQPGATDPQGERIMRALNLAPGVPG